MSLLWKLHPVREAQTCVFTYLRTSQLHKDASHLHLQALSEIRNLLLSLMPS